MTVPSRFVRHTEGASWDVYSVKIGDVEGKGTKIWFEWRNRSLKSRDLSQRTHSLRGLELSISLSLSLPLPLPV